MLRKHIESLVSKSNPFIVLCFQEMRKNSMILINVSASYKSSLNCSSETFFDRHTNSSQSKNAGLKILCTKCNSLKKSNFVWLGMELHSTSPYILNYIITILSRIIKTLFSTCFQLRSNYLKFSCLQNTSYEENSIKQGESKEEKTIILAINSCVWKRRSKTVAAVVTTKTVSFPKVRN